MKKIVKLTEQDLTRIVKRVIKETQIYQLNEMDGLDERRINQLWDDTYRWLEVFSTDDNIFLLTNNIRSGIWLRRAVEEGKVTSEQLDKIATNGEQVYSTLPIVMELNK